MFKLVVKGLMLAAAIVFSGCSVKSVDRTYAKPFFDDKSVVLILADIDTTSVALPSASISMMYKNYLYSLALSAETAKKMGYKYFTIRNLGGNDELEKAYKMENATTVQLRLDACVEGEGSFGVWSPLGMSQETCNSLLGRTYMLYSAIGIRESHAPIKYFIDMSNEPINQYTSFAVDEVLANKEIQGVIEQFKESFESDKVEFVERKIKTDAYAKEHPDKVKK